MQPESSVVTKLRDVIRLMQRDAYILVKRNRPGTEEAKRGLQIGALSVALLDAIGDTQLFWYHAEPEFDADAVRRISAECHVLGLDEYEDKIDQAMSVERNGECHED